MSTENESWAVEEFGQAVLGDLRRRQRLIRLAEQRMLQPNASIPQCCPTAADKKAAYRFYENDDISFQEILTSHTQATAGRLGKEKLILAVQDTTELAFTHHPAMVGQGKLNNQHNRGLLLHSTLAVTPARVPLGLIKVQVWARPDDGVAKRHRRRSLPIREKESYKWLRSLQATAKLAEELPQTKIVSVGDREADIYDLFVLAQELKQEVLVRAAWDRRVGHPQGHLWPCLESQPVAGSISVTVPRKGGKDRRTALVGVRWAGVTILPPKHRGEGLKPITIWACLAWEEAAPEGEEGICWLLLTTAEVKSFEQACEKVQWYSCRWLVEVYHKVLKSGCRVEERQFDEADNLKRYLAVDMVVAWRVLFLSMIGREQPNLPCDVILELHEWQALYCFIHKSNAPPPQPPTLAEVTRWIAQLGGFMGRKRDGHPGVIVIWRGLQRLSDIAAAWQVFHSPPTPQPFVGNA